MENVQTSYQATHLPIICRKNRQNGRRSADMAGNMAQKCAQTRATPFKAPYLTRFQHKPIIRKSAGRRIPKGDRKALWGARLSSPVATKRKPNESAETSGLWPRRLRLRMRPQARNPSCGGSASPLWKRGEGFRSARATPPAASLRVLIEVALRASTRGLQFRRICYKIG